LSSISNWLKFHITDTEAPQTHSRWFIN